MSQPTDSLDVVDLKAVTAGGIVREDALDKIYGTDTRGTPFLDAVGTGSFSNNYSEWFEEELLTSSTTNKYSSGTDYAPSTAGHGHRVGNHAQISRRGVNVTDRAEGVDKIGGVGSMGYETGRQLQGLRYDQEAIALSNQASIADNPGTTVGTTAGLGAVLKTNTFGGTHFVAGGFNTSTKVVDAPTVGSHRALTWSLVTGAIEACYLLGSKPTQLLSVPQVTKRIGNFLIDTKKVQFVANINGTTEESLVSNQFVDCFKTDFGYTMCITPDLWQPTYKAYDTSTDVAVVYGIDPAYIEKASLYGTKVTVLAKNGDYDRKMLQEDWMLKTKLERALFGIYDIIPTSDVTA